MERNMDDLVNVLVIYTGGTIGMIQNEKNALVPSKMIRHLLENDSSFNDNYLLCSKYPSLKKDGYLLLPKIDPTMKRVAYKLIEFEDPIDSSNVCMADWAKMARSIYDNYKKFDGFVVLHGTDTLSYTSSALSFMFENLSKPVVVTGSQIPIFSPRSDGRDNFISSVLLAGNVKIPEVTVFFCNNLFRGNRIIKQSSNKLDAFASYNTPPLVTAGISFDVHYKPIFRPSQLEEFKATFKLNEHVGLLRIFPTISTEIVRVFLQPPIQGVVLQTYGAGNMPINRKDFIQALKDACDRGVIIITCTQCIEGSVDEIYETGKFFKSIGITPGLDMTPEAALTKLAYVLSIDSISNDEKKKLMTTSLRGELTTKDDEDESLYEMVVKTFGMATPVHRTVKGLKSSILMGLIESAVYNQDLPLLINIYKHISHANWTDWEGRTPLHIAACQGDVDIIKFLLEKGLEINSIDKWGKTPLMDAVLWDQHEVIKILKEEGGELKFPRNELAFLLSMASAEGNLKRLESFALAGADYRLETQDGRSPLHYAVLNKRPSSISFLLKQGVEKNKEDSLGYTPLRVAQKLGAQEIVQILSK